MATEDVVKLARSLLKEYMAKGKQLLIVIDDLTQVITSCTMKMMTMMMMISIHSNFI